MAKEHIRCAIYTRKSSEEGLEQSFNSLDAQREACCAFILSQKHEGWTVLPALYDDGAYSGGTMDRPALQRMLEDIRTRKIDVVVVYKVDRLTRSLADFAKIVEVFDALKGEQSFGIGLCLGEHPGQARQARKGEQAWPAVLPGEVRGGADGGEFVGGEVLRFIDEDGQPDNHFARGRGEVSNEFREVGLQSPCVGSAAGAVGEV